MLGNVIITTPKNMPSIQKICVFVDSEPIVVMSKSETQTIELSCNSTISIQSKAPIGMGNLVGPISVSAANSTKIDVTYSMFSGKYSLDVVSTTKVCDYYEEDNMEKPIFEFDGALNDTITLYEDYLVIKHTGVLNAMSMGIKGDKNIFYSDITSVQYKKPGFSAGYIQFSLPGGNENKAGVFGAMSDENTIAVASGNAQIEFNAQKVVDIINKKIRELKTNNNSAPAIIQQISPADELKKFKELLDSGVITQEEFDVKKKQLLGL